MSLNKTNLDKKFSIPWKLVVLFILFSIGIVTTGILYYLSQRNRIFREQGDNLTAIATLKINQITQWHDERLGDAALIRDNDPLIRNIKQFFINEKLPENKKELLKWMGSVLNEYDYSGVSIVDTRLKTRLQVSLSDSVRITGIRNDLAEVFENGEIVMKDLHKAANSDDIHLDLLVPLVDPDSFEQEVFGIMILRIDPNKVLFPLIQSWPTPSKSSETLLLRVEKDSIVFLNELRHLKNSALTLKRSFSDDNLLATKAANGFIGISEGIDYRNIPVVGFLTRIDVLSWFMVAKVDKEEIQFPLRRVLYISIIVIVLLVLINASVFVFWIWQQRVILYKNQLLHELQRKHLETEIRKSEERFRSTLENMMEGCQIISSDWEYLYINNAADQHNHRPKSELLGKKYMDMWPGIEKTEVFRNIKKCIEKKISVRLETKFVFLDATEGWFDLRIQSVPEGVFILSIDISERKKAEEEIRKLNTELENRVMLRTLQLEASNKELEAFSYSVSHDLRAPLRSIHSFTRILQDEYFEKLDDEGKRLFGIVTSSAAQMGQLIDDLLSFSRIGRSSINPIVLDMKYMAGSIFQELTSEKEKLTTNLQIGNLIKAYGDPVLIRQVWNNLISNAIKYSSKEKNSNIFIDSKLDGDQIIYSIKDNGVGFDMQYKHKLFGVFQRLHSESEFEGNGVGLAIIKRIILRHGGTVWAEGETGTGATFYFSLPLNGEMKILEQL